MRISQAREIADQFWPEIVLRVFSVLRGLRRAPFAPRPLIEPVFDTEAQTRREPQSRRQDRGQSSREYSMHVARRGPSGVTNELGLAIYLLVIAKFTSKSTRGLPDTIALIPARKSRIGARSAGAFSRHFCAIPNRQSPAPPVFRPIRSRTPVVDANSIRLCDVDHSVRTQQIVWVIGSNLISAFRLQPCTSGPPPSAPLLFFTRM